MDKVLSGFGREKKEKVSDSDENSGDEISGIPHKRLYCKWGNELDLGRVDWPPGRVPKIHEFALCNV